MLRQYQGSDQLKTNDGDRTWYLTMNTTQPPFDDVHVRRAANFVMDRVGLRKAWGGPAAGAVATHIAPDAILDNKLKGYAPYGSIGQGRRRQGQGRDEAVQVRHQQGRPLRRQGAARTSSRCRATAPSARRWSPSCEASMKKIGITLKTRVLKDAYTPIQTPRQNIPFSLRPGWGKDYADATTFYGPLFDGRNIIAEEQHQLLAARHHARDGQEGRRQGQHHRRAERERRSRQVRADRRGPRSSCYAALDKKLTTQDRAVGSVPLVATRRPSSRRT